MPSANHNNGNVIAITDQLNSARTQNFTYDPINRLASATETAWGLNFGYDSRGNLLQQTVTQGWAPQWNQSVDGNNRLLGFGYDAAGNMTSDGVHTYQWDGEERLKSLDNTAASYTYDVDGGRVRKDSGGGYTEYVYFNGQAIAQLNGTSGGWSDYIYANGKFLAKADNFDVRVHIYGSTPAGAGAQYEGYNFTGNTAISGYVVQNGDKLFVRQFQTQSTTCGGVDISFTDGSRLGFSLSDSDGYLVNEDQWHGAWHFRKFDLSSYAGKTVSVPLLLLEACTQASGQWDIYYSDFVIVSANGTVRPVLDRQPSVSFSMWGSSGIVNPSYEVNKSISTGDAVLANLNTYYYHSDHLGSSRLMTAGEGWPIWQATYTPFGYEYNPLITADNYKFTGLERDNESGLDHTLFRQYSSNQGRWMSPDPAGLAAVDPTNPQTWNRYAYVMNNPVNLSDSLGPRSGSSKFAVHSPRQIVRALFQVSVLTS